MPLDLVLIADVGAMTTNLLLDIAWTHVTARVRQTLVGMAGVAIGVGFTIMMAGLMQGSQIDFLRQLVDTMPHITVQDERRAAPAQPADRDYGAVQMSSVANVGGRRGIKYPDTVMTSLRSWLPGDVAIGQDHGDHRSWRGPYRYHAGRHRSSAGGQGVEARFADARRADHRSQPFAQCDHHRPGAGREARGADGQHCDLDRR